MDVAQIVAVGGGIVGIATSFYMFARFGVRVDQLWIDRDRTAEKTAGLERDSVRCDERIQRVDQRIDDIQMFILHKAEAEAKVKRAIRERD